MAGTLTIPLTSLPTGARVFGPATVADADTATVLSIDRTVAGGLDSLTAASSLELLVEQSNDGGTTWFLIVDGILSGGPVPSFHGLGGFVEANWAPGTGRRARATLTVAGGPVTVQGTLTTS